MEKNDVVGKIVNDVKTASNFRENALKEGVEKSGAVEKIVNELKKNAKAKENEKMTENMKQESMKEFLLSREYETIGWLVRTCEDIASGYGDYKAEASEAVIACRRKFKLEDIILFAQYSPFYRGKYCSGIIFTENKLFTCSPTTFGDVIEYSEIEDVDFDASKEVIIKTTNNGEKHLYSPASSGDRCNHAPHLYNIIMDIKEKLEES